MLAFKGGAELFRLQSLIVASIAVYIKIYKMRAGSGHGTVQYS